MDQKIKKKLWKALEDHSQALRLHIPQNFASASDTTSFQSSAFSCNIHLDYSHQHITQKTLELLFSLAEACQLQDKINALFYGDIVNISENRPALHTALRSEGEKPILVNKRNVMSDILATREKMLHIADQIREKLWLGFSGQPITDIVNIGIGGSDLGPRFCLRALAAFSSKELNYHFISDADPNSFNQIVEKLYPETTLFIISSKSFTTLETLYNAQKALDWIGSSNRHKRHFIAVTASIEKANKFGITTVLPMWEWIGGRYSFCSAINLITAIAIGSKQFNQVLAGANSMDRHFQQNDFATNLPILLALLGVWNNNFLHIHTLLVLTYASPLEHFTSYLQQLDMESNGKSIDNKGKTVNYATGPIVWGGSGTQAQHSYYQLLCQGTHKITADFISLKDYDGHIINDLCEEKIKLLTVGINRPENPSGFIPGNIPLNHVRVNRLSPFTIGELIALYEHKIFTQSIIWNINPFDQPGVESAKKNYKKQKIALQIG